ncbi:MAG TPA: kelch repeat-containing protein [Candidatus Limnocylindrales bacterium]|nr:kelch repeat-containing protein [Candidatus Limnocylindrales bacterium]
MASVVALAGCGPVPPSVSPTGVSPLPTTSTSAAVGASPPSSATGSISVTTLPVALPVPLSRAVAFAAGSEILVCGGLLGSGATTSAIVRIDPAGESAIRVGSLAVGVHDAAGASLGDLNLVIGGGRGLAVTTIQTCQPDGSATVTGHLPAPRADASGVGVIDAGSPEVVVVGGGDAGVLEPAVLATSDGSATSRIATLAVGVRYAAIVAIGRSVVVIGGFRTSADTADIQTIDLDTGRTRIVGRLPAPLAHAAAFAMDGRIVVAGGTVGGTAQRAIWAIDPSTWAVSRLGDLPVALSDMAVVSLDGSADLVGGVGVDGPVSSIVEIRPG